MNKPKPKTSDEGKNVPNKSLVGFFGDLKTEFRKITWTEKDELNVYTKVVVVSTFAMGVAIYLADLSVQGALATIANAVRMITG